MVIWNQGDPSCELPLLSRGKQPGGEEGNSQTKIGKVLKEKLEKMILLCSKAFEGFDIILSIII